MRVIGGSAKGRRLVSLRGLTIRPTSEKVREAVFDILQGYFPCERILDIFAGTGAMGIEAMSRGAGEAVFIDANRRVASLIRENLERTGFSQRAKVLQMDAVDAIKLLSSRRERFDLVFIDPPYENSLIEKVLTCIDHDGLLTAGGVAVSESSRKRGDQGKLATLTLFKKRGYGDTVVSFYKAPETV
ncbi:MAG: 16S rRNA (guanine(966)-N(2))-methyltransferase RsmD [Thermodesulfobacteriota bacterium]